MAGKPRHDGIVINTANGCTAKAASIRRVATYLSDPDSIRRALAMAKRWDDKAMELATRGM
jgi:hypothetical protein